MKKGKIKLIVIGVILAIIILAIIISIIVSKVSEKNNVNNNIIYVNDIPQEVTVDSEDDIVLADEEGIIGTLEIPKIGVSAPIKEGTDWETMKEYIGHFSNSSIWEGNVCLASHNRGSLVKHYFEKINELVNGDTIIYKTVLGERTYQVVSTKEITNTDWSITENTEDKNIITLVTCIKNQPEKRFCVVAEEKI